MNILVITAAEAYKVITIGGDNWYFVNNSNADRFLDTQLHFSCVLITGQRYSDVSVKLRQRINERSTGRFMEL